MLTTVIYSEGYLDNTGAAPSMSGDLYDATIIADDERNTVVQDINMT